MSEQDELVERVAKAIRAERNRIHTRDMVRGFDRSEWEQARAAIDAVRAEDDKRGLILVRRADLLDWGIIPYLPDKTALGEGTDGGEG